jgi:hypothetical protein
LVDYKIISYWDNQKLKKVKIWKQLFYYNANDSIIKIEDFEYDTFGVLKPCVSDRRYMNYDINKLKISTLDSNNFVQPFCQLGFAGRDSLSYYSNNLVKEKYQLIDYYPSFSGDHRYNYSYYIATNNLKTIMTSYFGTFYTWDTFQLRSYYYQINGILVIDSTWDNLNHIWLPTNEIDFYYNSKFDRYRNQLTSKYEHLFYNKRSSADSTHYYYHIPSCLSYYTTDYDTLTNSFNLTLDSITNTQAVAYHWNFGDGSSSNLQYPSHTYLVDTTYNVCLTIYKSNGDSCTYCHIIGKDYQGHIIKSAGFNLNVKGQGNIGVNEIVNEKVELVVYPNPVNNVLICKYANVLMNTIEITDVLSRTIIQQINNSSTQQISINVAELPHGIYFIKATDEKGNSYNTKFVKQ